MLDDDLDARLLGEFLADLGQALVAFVAIDPDQQGACFGRVRHADGGQVADAGQGGGDQVVLMKLRFGCVKDMSISSIFLMLSLC
jgi:hypothetical protein